MAIHFFLKHSTNKSCYVQEFSDAQLTKCFIGNRAVCRVSFYNPEKPPLVSITSRWDKGENIRKFLFKTLWFGAVTGPSLCFFCIEFIICIIIFLITELDNQAPIYSVRIKQSWWYELHIQMTFLNLISLLYFLWHYLKHSIGKL